MNPYASRLKLQPIKNLNKRSIDLDLIELEKIHFVNRMEKMIKSKSISPEVRTPTFSKSLDKKDGIKEGFPKKVKNNNKRLLKIYDESKESENNEQSTFPCTQQTKKLQQTNDRRQKL
ncbi:unnamed protein product (macronuclear) [Paramecium tetraurelia]|uniref:Uncharacterized protein n=1 Tax=Paramecium tetraurelia TaxID=5888 RepID=A0DWH7_PARTE|nr:uncharacterized protein GSPATT00021036001 [Paramecium tetraurelia]CAK87394.1 unnamed protein product [Paramecium tetraurelia]|eukprot:XP_001454791.1 hypothetical protein (macronuclear) [Paramecium tetraurelia strain d4-2]